MRTYSFKHSYCQSTTCLSVILSVILSFCPCPWSSISQQPCEIHRRFISTTNRKPHIASPMVTWHLKATERAYHAVRLPACLIFIFNIRSLRNRICYSFYLRDAMLARVFATATCPSVRPSVCHTPVLCLVFYHTTIVSHRIFMKERLAATASTKRLVIFCLCWRLSLGLHV